MSLPAIAWSVARYVWTEPSNRRERVRRLAYAVAWQAWRATIGLPVVVRIDNGLRLIADPRAIGCSFAIYAHTYDSRQVGFLRQHVIPGGTLCDVGANVGLFTLHLAPLFRRGWCYEPLPGAYQLLASTLALNDLKAFRARPVAVLDQPGAVRLLADSPTSPVAQVATAEETPEQPAFAVEAVSLDSELEDVTDLRCLKIDVEGHELAVLRGATRTIRQNRQAIVMFERLERTPIEPLLAFFADLGWQVFAVGRVGQPSYEPRSLAAAHDLFAWSPEHPRFER